MRREGLKGEARGSHRVPSRRWALVFQRCCGLGRVGPANGLAQPLSDGEEDVKSGRGVTRR